MNKNLLYRNIPKVDILLEEKKIQELINIYGREMVVETIREELDLLREYIKECEEEESALARINTLIENIEKHIIQINTPDIKSVINGTGTILHTNLGRAPIGLKHMQYIAEIATGYSNLEYNLEEGRRGERYSHFEQLLCKITGAEAAMAVNNNAAAVMLILSTLGKGKEIVVSRGELVEIGGKFRVPDVMEQSGAVLVEVGTTNKTHFSDYEKAITEETGALLKVHTSNYRIVGFTETVPIEELVPLGKQYHLPIIEDLGSGVLIDLSKYGLAYEPTVQDSIRHGADVVCFSGDKLLGGAQAGIIVGKKEYIDRMKKNQMTRALRIDKFTATTLDVILHEYLSEEKAIKNIPALYMITESLEEVTKRAKSLQRMLRKMNLDAEIALEKCESQIGGGSLPLERIASMAVTIKPLHITTAELEERMRHLPIPIIPRTMNDKIVLDVRTIEQRFFKTIAKQLKESNIFEEKA
ncbi:L-seryl-tRNA(Sec) selenium transferase [Faecalimonas sp.]